MATLLGQLCYSRYVVLMSLNPNVLLDCFSVSLTFRLYCRSNSIGFHYINYGLLRKFVTIILILTKTFVCTAKVE